MTQRYVAWFGELGAGDLARVGGRNAASGESVRALKREEGRVLHGFVATVRHVAGLEKRGPGGRRG